MSQPSDARAAGATRTERLVRFLERPGLPLAAAALGTLLLSPTLFIGFHLDDYVHRYLFSGLSGSRELLRAYQSPFGIANGEPAINHWQIEHGYAPWWAYPRLLISLFRPVSELTHRLDAVLWPDSALLQHAHSLVFYFALALVAGRFYRALAGPTTIAGAAALMYAIDPAHGFAAGWIANRNALCAALFGLLALLWHDRARREGARAPAVLAPLAFGCALLAGEGAVAVLAYLIGYALFVDRASPGRRLASLVPHVLIAIAWRVAYHALGRGAEYSGLYLDPAREPLRFAAAIGERVPLLLLGQFGLPSAETYQFLPGGWAHAMWLLALLTALAVSVSFWPLVRADTRARFWAFGMVASLAPACSTYAANRLLFFVGIGALALLSQLWHGVVLKQAWLPTSRAWRGLARGFVICSVGYHLLWAPLILPIDGCSIALSGTAETAAESALAAGAGRDLVILSSPDFFYVKLVPVLAALEHRQGPRRLRALSFGPVGLRIRRPDPYALEVEYQGGLLASPLLELYRARSLPMPIGSEVRLEGMLARVERLTADGRVAAARFVFDAPLDDARFVFLAWQDGAYRRVQPPLVAGRLELEPAAIGFSWPSATKRKP